MKKAKEYAAAADDCLDASNESGISREERVESLLEAQVYASLAVAAAVAQGLLRGQVEGDEE